MWWRKQPRAAKWTCRPAEGFLPWHELSGELVSLLPVLDHSAMVQLMDDHVREGQGFNDDPEYFPPEWLAQQNLDPLLGFEFQISAYGSQRPLGWVSVTSFEHSTAQIGYWMGAKGRNRGFTSEAAQLVTKFALGHLGMASVTAEAAQQNTGSIRVAQHAGLHIVGSSSSTRPNGKTFETFVLARDDGPFPGAARCTGIGLR
jgi:RimJ/RimL family protein N-acetyltransferase